MGLRVREMKRDESGRLLIVYDLRNPGPRTVLDLEVSVLVSREGVKTEMTIDGPLASTVDEAPDKLADWLERSSQAIRARERGNSTIVELFGDGPEPVP